MNQLQKSFESTIRTALLIFWLSPLVSWAVMFWVAHGQPHVKKSFHVAFDTAAVCAFFFWCFWGLDRIWDRKLGASGVSAGTGKQHQVKNQEVLDFLQAKRWIISLSSLMVASGLLASWVLYFLTHSGVALMFAVFPTGYWPSMRRRMETVGRRFTESEQTPH
ncbi:MAG: hypothetical protein HY318_12180 [Armatimonadetes bacterium]|nr:hypothetical protein [Armatimonadota bacterium]